ncbi:ABC transporter permease [Fructilactobacillus sanfranciscensis]|uniref:ABC transporter permease n=1 Tax=Fructilactobacillus sanfranciscensis TaxID=1625 RepID=UPI00111A3CBD|nr:ABC transporter permease subunit [Fructilactobacillus sanfranciscensis]MVF15994.1 hypothetical protein [Fructilactobacillus sanfranciscensis]TNK95148.1 hypothetical protein DKP74_06180 [Fructilactobacillus sanfranciscensis]TNK97084.1 hypothetical protein DKP75_05625 [Fructilactobacillus sanfranciscensis]
MLFLYKKEFFKLINQSKTYVLILLLIIQNMFFAVISSKYPSHFVSKELFVSDYASLSFIGIILIIHAASIIPMEFEFNTMKNILISKYSRQEIIISKILLTATYSIILYLIAMISTIINKFLFFQNDFYLNDHLKNSTQTIFRYWIETNATNILTLWLILSIVILISCALKKSSIAVAIGIIGYLILNIISNSMFILIKKFHFLKWNPINLLNLPLQVSLPDKMNKLTLLSNHQMIICIIIYIIVFNIISITFFSKKEF